MASASSVTVGEFGPRLRISVIRPYWVTVSPAGSSMSSYNWGYPARRLAKRGRAAPGQVPVVRFHPISPSARYSHTRIGLNLACKALLFQDRTGIDSCRTTPAAQISGTAPRKSSRVPAFYVTAGEGKHVVVLLHGFPSTWWAG